jgi:MFS transporter, DHA1 family, inner membrane transport protein
MPLPLFALFIAAFAVGTTELVVAGLLPALAADLSVDIPTAGLLITGYALGVAVGGPILILASGRFPRRGLLIAMMLVFILGNALCALATSYWLLMGARLVISASHGVFFGVALVIATRLVSRARQASAVSFVVAGITVANVIGAPLGTAIGNAFGWRMAFWAIVAIGGVATIALALLIPAAPQTGGHAAPTMAAEIRAAIRQPVLTSFLMIALGMIAFFLPFTFIVPILTEVTGLSTGLVPVLLFVSGAGGILGNFLGGRLGDWRPMPAMVAILALEVVLYLAAVPAVHNAIAMGIVFFLWSLVGFSFSAPVQARILNAAHDAPNLVSTLISTAYNVGIAAGAWLGGVALNTGWHYAQLPGISAVFVAIALAVAILSWALDRRGRAGEPDFPVT